MTPGRIAVEILDVRGSTGDPDWDAFKGGINDMLMHDVLPRVGTAGPPHRGRPPRRPDQGARVPAVSVRRSVDPRHAQPHPRRRRDARLDRAGRGRRAKSRMTIVDKHSGTALGTRETTLDRDGWPDKLEALGKSLADDLCKLSDVFEVTLDVGGEGRFATHSARARSTRRCARGGASRAGRSGAPPGRCNGPASASPRRSPSARYRHVIPVISWTVTIIDAGGGELAGDVEARRQRGGVGVGRLPAERSGRPRPTADPRHAGALRC